ncbi:head GIN domain-containing protein [Sphingosinicella rhizophila]|uniref:Head GIN domain-containing protein n=1 Tax=Sphingosinicella rhizophila TaxID=3050082 RepID=A0ABU3Q8D5_9SPHN|nr:head GIN domain-containing protein [Sphingosinicella sp. GR2756]MDT9599670.1 head GIN domain-containing protein [Sphingosinicella sp. GR2756]
MRAAMILVTALGACSMSADAERGPEAGDGRTGQRAFEVGRFDTISLGGSYDVSVNVGGATSVRAQGDPELLDRLEVDVVRGDLRIRTKRGNWSWNSVRGRAPVRIHVTTPALAGASIGGSGDMRIDKVDGSGFTGSIGGSGNMEIASLRTGKADFSIAGSGDIKATGSAGRSTISIAGSGNADLAQLEVRTANISVVGSGNVRARATDVADVSILGSGDVTMSGPARCKVSKLGSGDVRCGA